MDFKARAKLNLSLNVVGKANGLHLIESVFLPINICDDVSIVPNDTDVITLRYSDRSDPYVNDTALKAARVIKGRYFTGGVDIKISKRIPERAGLGGSSADAAAVAKGMATLFDLDISPSVLLSIGSDVPAMFASVPCFVSGAGEKVVPIEGVKYPDLVILIPDGGVDTGVCFDRYDAIGGQNGNISEVIAALKAGRDFCPNNALTDAAISLLPEIGEGLKVLKEYFPCGMTGSGSAIFGLCYDGEFANKVDEIKKSVGDKFKIITLSSKEI